MVQEQAPQHTPRPTRYIRSSMPLPECREPLVCAGSRFLTQPNSPALVQPRANEYECVCGSTVAYSTSKCYMWSVRM